MVVGEVVNGKCTGSYKAFLSTLPEHSKLVIQLASFTHVLLHLLSYNHLYLRLKMGAAVA